MKTEIKSSYKQLLLLGLILYIKIILLVNEKKQH